MKLRIDLVDDYDDILATGYSEDWHSPVHTSTQKNGYATAVIYRVQDASSRVGIEPVQIKAGYTVTIEPKDIKGFVELEESK